MRESYATYLQWHDTPSRIAESSKAVHQLSRSPLFSIIVPVFQSDCDLLRATLESVRSQTYSHWELIVAEDGPQEKSLLQLLQQFQNTAPTQVHIVPSTKQLGISATTNRGAQFAKGEYIGFVDHDDLLSPDALEKIATAIDASDEEPDILYTDHDKIAMDGKRYDPEFKPDWSPETLLSWNYIGHMKLLRRTLFHSLQGLRSEFDGSQDYDLMLRATEVTDRVQHVPHICYHWRAAPRSIASGGPAKPETIWCGRKALREALERRGVEAEVVIPAFAKQKMLGIGTLQFHCQNDAPLVSIILNHRSSGAERKRCIEHIRTHTDYPHYEILVSSTIHIDTHSTGEFLLFLDDTVEIQEPEWLTQMVGVMKMDNRIGAVGAKILSPKGRVRHGGYMTSTLDTPVRHANAGLRHDDLGYVYTNQVMRNVSAVSKACMLVRADQFHELGEFDEQNQPEEYHGVDYCLRLRALGYRTIWQPAASCIRHEQEHSTLGDPGTKSNRMAFHSRWNKQLDDPYVHPQISRKSCLYALRTTPLEKSLLFLSHNLSLEGASISLFEIVNALHERGYAVQVIALQDGPLHQWYQARGISVLLHTPESAAAILNCGSDYDMVFANTLATLVFLEYFHVDTHRVVLCIRESDPHAYIDTSTEYSEIFEGVTPLFVSHDVRDLYTEFGCLNAPVILKRLDLAPIDMELARTDKQSARQVIDLPEDTFVLSIIGTLCERKQQLLLLKALRTLKNSYPHLHVLLVGEQMREPLFYKQIVDYIKHYDLSKHVTLMDPRPDIYTVYSATDIYICTSKYESGPRTVLEAMASRLPIIASDIPGMREQFRDGEEGLLIPQGDLSSLKKAIVSLVDHPDRRALLAANARRRIERDPSFGTMIDRYEEVFLSVIDNGMPLHTTTPATLATAC